MATNLGYLIEKAAAVRKRGDWAAARQLYESAAAHAPAQAEIRHNLALCLHALGLHGKALEHSIAATRRASGVAAAWVLRAKIERALDKIEPAEASLRRVLDDDPLEPRATMELAGLLLNELGDAKGTQLLVFPLLRNVAHEQDARLAMLMAKLYDREESAEQVTRQLRKYSERFLRLPGICFSGKRVERPAGSRPRVGLLSPLFCASPVYFLTYGALSLLSDEVDFVGFNRGSRSDWATEKFRSMTREWYEVAHLPAEPLAHTLHSQYLDVLFDMGGWADPVGLKALSSKPAIRMYKWVGGQSCTTGLTAFDGYISDRYQTPRGTAHLYAEPLVLLDQGYVSYTPPSHAIATSILQRRTAHGVVSNPVKLSGSFLRELPSLLDQLAPDGGVVRFIDRRYRHDSLRKRVLSALRTGRHRIEFVSPTSQGNFLDQLQRLDTVIDTSPYNGGLTTLEALSNGARCLTRPGSLFCERHSESHLRCSGLNIERLPNGFLAGGPGVPVQRARPAHEAVAAALRNLMDIESSHPRHAKNH